jgi:hypothetical protein
MLTGNTRLLFGIGTEKREDLILKKWNFKQEYSFISEIIKL